VSELEIVVVAYTVGAAAGSIRRLHRDDDLGVALRPVGLDGVVVIVRAVGGSPSHAHILITG
jgi:hypothetical protein